MAEGGDGEKSDFIVLREKLKIEQLEPGVRRLERELALLNRSEKAKKEFLLLLEDFLPGLAVKNGAGEELTYLPTSEMKREVGDLDAFVKELAGDAWTPTTRLLWVLFDAPVEKGATTIVRLTFEDEEEGADLKFITHPWFKVDIRKREDGHDTFVEIRAPSEGLLVVKPLVGMPPEGKDETPAGVKHRILPRFVQVRVPAKHEGASFRYYMWPNASERSLLWLSIVLLTAVPIAMLLFAWVGAIKLIGADNSSGEIVGTLGISGILGIIAFVKPTWTNRVWYMVPALAYLVLLFVSLQ